MTYANSQAVFSPVAALASQTAFTAAVTTGVRSASGNGLMTGYTWSFTTGNPVVAVAPVNLRAASNYVILAGSEISTVPTSAITGNIGLSPAAGTYITGFSLIEDPTNVFYTSTQVIGKVYAADSTPPTPANLTTAISDMGTAFTDAAGRAPSVTQLGTGNIGGMTLTPGVYAWSTNLLIPTDATLTGSATDVWIFQIAQDVTLSGGARILCRVARFPRTYSGRSAAL